MSVFKSVLISFKRNFRIVTIYFAVFIVISFAMLSILNDKVDGQFERVKPTVLLIEQGATSEFNEQFKHFLNSIAHVEQPTSDRLLARDLVESEQYAMLIVLDEDAAANLATGAPVLETYYNDSDNGAILIANQLSSYFRYLNASQNISGSADYATVKNAMASHVPVELINKKSATDKKAIWFSYYMVNLAYIVIVLFTILLILVLQAYNEPALVNRRSLAKLSKFKQSLLMGAAGTTSLIAIALLFFLLGLALVGFAVPLRQIVLHLLNLVAFSTTVISFTMLLISFNIKPNFAHAVANVISLSTAFVSGIWIPLEFLPSIVVNFAKLLPAYYYVKLANGIVDGGVDVALLIAIQLLFTVCYSAISWYLNQHLLAKTQAAL